MRISDWSSDVCSSDRCTAISLRPYRGVKQDGLEDLAIDNEKGQTEQKPRRPARQRGGDFLLDIALPSFGIALAMHPDTDRDQNDRGEERTKAFSEPARCPAAPSKIGCHKPGQPPHGTTQTPPHKYQTPTIRSPS